MALNNMVIKQYLNTLLISVKILYAKIRANFLDKLV